MDLVRSLFGGLHGDDAPPSSMPPLRPSGGAARSRPAPLPAGRCPSFDPTLVPSLQADHRALLELIKRAAAAAATDNTQAAIRALHKFHTLLSEHLLTENTRLYLYIRASAPGRAPDAAQMSRGFQVEMNQIARGISHFVERYTEREHMILGPAFMVDLDSVRQTLRARFAREESTLFPLYAPA